MTIRVVTCNVNGLRAAYKKGLFDWLEGINADVICLQEIKAHYDQISALKLSGYEHYYALAEKKGYSGVGILSRLPVKFVEESFGESHMDSEGRFLRLEFENFSVVSFYIPSGSYDAQRQKIKMDLALNHLLPWFKRTADMPCIVCGDFNVAHTKQDIKNWQANQKKSGFLPEERAWFSAILELGYSDVFRALYPEKTQYTWWSNRGGAWANNVGWRIDYQVVSRPLKGVYLNSHVYMDERFSDHAPLIADYDIN